MKTFLTLALMVGAYLVMAILIRTRSGMNPLVRAITSILLIIAIVGVAWIFGLIK